MCKRLITLLGLVMTLCVACVVDTPPVSNPNCPPPIPNCDGSQP